MVLIILSFFSIIIIKVFRSFWIVFFYQSYTRLQDKMLFLIICAHDFLMLCHPWILKINSLVNTWLWYIVKTPFGFEFLMLYWISFFFFNIYGDKWDRTINFLLSLADSVCAHSFDIFSPFRINRIILRNIKVYQGFIYISFRLYF